MALVRSSGIGIVGLDEVVADAQVRCDVKDRFGSLLSLYEQYLELPAGEHLDIYSWKSLWLEQNVNEVLTAREIDSFLHLTQLYEENPKYNSDEGRTGIFLTRLMQVAYEQGETDFMLNMKELQPLHFLGTRFAHNNQKINVTIEGTVGNYCFANTILKTANINTALNYCLERATVETVNIGTAGKLCLHDAAVETANIGTAGICCLHEATVGTVNIRTAGLGFIIDVKKVGTVYTSDSSLVDQLKKYQSTNWIPGGGIHIIPPDELEEKMRQSGGGQ